MKRILFFLILLFPFVAAFPNEYKDPVTNVVYTFDPIGNTAQVKPGVEEIDIDSRSYSGLDMNYHDGLIYPGSPEAKTAIVILDRFAVDGKEYKVEKIGDYAFANMRNIMSVTIPSSVKSIGCMAFFGCDVLSDVVLNEGLTSIGEMAFAGCESLSTISFPESLLEIESRAFQKCVKLESVFIPANIIRLGTMSFYCCYALSKIQVAESNSVFDSRDNCNAIIETATNKLLMGCKETEIPATVTLIDDMAFVSCKGLKSINVPQSVEEIGVSAFEDCTDLINISLSEGLKTIKSGAFYGAGLSSITIPSSVLSIGTGAFSSPAIRTITSLIMNPFEVQYICLQQKKVTLRVPIGTKSIYETTSGWNDFRAIEEIQPSGIRTITLQTTLHSFFDLQGRRIQGSPKHGVYVQNGKKVMKLGN